MSNFPFEIRSTNRVMHTIPFCVLSEVLIWVYIFHKLYQTADYKQKISKKTKIELPIESHAPQWFCRLQGLFNFFWQSQASQV